jgi:hypothetical protein
MKYSFQLAAAVLKRRGKNPRVMFVFRAIVPELGTENGHHKDIDPLPDITAAVEAAYKVLKDHEAYSKDIPRAGAFGAAYINLICTHYVDFDGHWKKAVKHCEAVQAEVKAACAGGPLDFWDTPVEVC